MVNSVTYMLKKCYVSKLTCLSLLDFKRKDNATRLVMLVVLN